MCLKPGQVLTLSLLVLAACQTPLLAQQNPAQVLIDRAKALDAQGRHGLAAENWRQVLLIEPRQPESLAALMRFYRASGDAVHAQQYETMLQKVRPGSTAPGSSAPTGENLQATLREASRLASLHIYPESLRLYRQAFGSAQPPDDWAVAYYETEAAIPASQPHAISGLRSLVQKYPANPSYQLALGRVLTYHPATRLEGARMLAHLQGSPEQNEQAQAAWKQAILWDVSAPAATETGKLYLDRYPDADLSTRLASALKHTVVARQTSPLEGEAYKALASGDLKGAMQKFTNMAAEPGHSGQGEAGLGYVSMKRKDFAAAVRHFEQARTAGLHSPALEKALRDARYWSAMSDGNSAMEASDADRASAEFTRARAVNGSRPEASEALGGSLLAEKDPLRAQAIFAEELKSNPGRPDAWIGWMNAALESGKAAEMLARQSTIPPEVKTVLARRADYLALLASGELAIGDAANAQRLLDRINQLAGAGSAQGSAVQVRAAGLLLSRGYSQQAAQLCVSAIKVDHENADAWQTLVQAEHNAGHDDIATRVATQMPQAVDSAAMRNPDFLLALAAVYQSQKRFSTASKLLQRASALGNLSGRSSLALQLQMASLALAEGDAHRAYTLYRSVQQQSPEKIEAWTGMVSALHAGKHDPEALATMESLSPSVTARLRHDPEFLQTAAFVYSENGRSREAMLCLRAVTQYYTQQHQQVPFSVDMAHAWLMLKEGNETELATTLDRVGQVRHLTSEQNSALHQVWAAWSIRRADAEYKKGDAKRAVAILQMAGQAYPERPELLTALAGMYVRSGNANFGMKMYEQMNWERASVEQFQAAIDSAMAARSRSYTDYWLKLALEQHPNDTTLLRLGAQIEEQRGNRRKAESYLQEAMGVGRGAADQGMLRAQMSEVPSSRKVREPREDALSTVPAASPQGELARMLGSGAKVAPMRPDSSESWSAPEPARSTEPQPEWTAVLKPLSYEPSDAAQGQVEGSPYLIESAYGGPAENTSATTVRRHRSPRAGWPGEQKAEAPVPTRSHEESYDARLELTNSSGPTQPSSDPLAGLGLDTPRSQRLEERPVTDRTNGPIDTLDAILKGADEDTSKSSLTDGLEAELTGRPEVRDPALTSSSTIVPGLSPIVNTAQQKAADDLAALESRYSPWLATGGAVRSHSGTAGFDQMQQYEAEIESSTVIGGLARVTVVSRPVLVQSGIPDSRSNYRFGSGASLPQTAQFASGLGAELQLATRSVQASIGISPSSFLVSNVIGGLAIRPAQGPFTFRAYRSSVKDSLLSYAGMKDPETGQIWGGVIATGGTIEFNRGGADSGLYASVDGQRLTGRGVADNTRIMGNAGAYWLAYANPYGRLKVGANLTAMHYALNQRYFTFGQGGYFSPDGFLMANAPVVWEGRPIYQTTYQVSGSLGAQNIQQGQAISGSLIAGNGIETITSASYDLHARVAHRVTEHWNIEGFLDTNNARQYADRSVGFTLRYMKAPQPADFVPTGFLNQTEIRPLLRP